MEGINIISVIVFVVGGLIALALFLKNIFKKEKKD